MGPVDPDSADYWHVDFLLSEIKRLTDSTSVDQERLKAIRELLPKIPDMRSVIENIEGGRYSYFKIEVQPRRGFEKSMDLELKHAQAIETAVNELDYLLQVLERTPEHQSVEQECSRGRKACDLIIDRLEKELERERRRLAACGTAALGYFDGCKDEYKSASLDDVLRLREENEALMKRAPDTSSVDQTNWAALKTEQLFHDHWSRSSKAPLKQAVAEALREAIRCTPDCPPPIGSEK
jgi:hypothetical protein